MAKQISGVSEKPFRNALKEAAINLKTGQKGWFFIGEGEEPLDKSIFDYVNSNSPKVHTSFTQSNKKFTGSNKVVLHLALTEFLEKYEKRPKEQKGLGI